MTKFKNLVMYFKNKLKFNQGQQIIYLKNGQTYRGFISEINLNAISIIDSNSNKIGDFFHYLVFKDYTDFDKFKVKLIKQKRKELIKQKKLRPVKLNLKQFYEDIQRNNKNTLIKKGLERFLNENKTRIY